MSGLREVLEAQVHERVVPGAVALVARGDEVEVAAAGSVDVEESASMARDSIFRIASITKPITAAAVMMLIDDGRLSLDDAVARWLPELTSPTVVRTPASALDDVVPANRPITVADLLTSRAGHGFPSDFTLPAVGPLFGELLQGPPQPQEVAPPDEWMTTLGRIPLLHQPGDGWLYNTSVAAGVGHAVPRRPGMGVRRLGRHRGHRAVERRRSLRLGRWNRHRRPHRPHTGQVTIVLTQVEMNGPTPPALMTGFWRYAAGTSDIEHA